MCGLKRIYTCLSCLLLVQGAGAQSSPKDSLHLKTIVADSSFQKTSHFFQWLWGRNRRVEWATPVTVPYFYLDSFEGGLKPYERGGGNETKSLRLRTPAGKEYALRSIRKSRDDVVVADFKKTFVEAIIHDGISSSYAYGALAIPELLKSAGIAHANPILVYVPHQPALDTFDAKFGDDLYFFEQRPDGNWSEAANLGNPVAFVTTDDLVKKILDDNSTQADQQTFLRARLIDMLVSDWDRHEDNWKWGRNDSMIGVYHPIPRDRDQAFYTHNGVLVDALLPAAGLGFMQNFDYTVKNISGLNAEERNMDRFFTNQLSLDDWVNEARNLKQTLTDEVIERSVKGLPPSLFDVSGKELIEKLKSRRRQLPEFATEYYRFLARAVDVPGSKKDEVFEINDEGTGNTQLSIYRMDQNNQREDSPYYRRIFKPDETKELRVYGIDGHDLFKVTRRAPGPVIRLVGGPGRDSMIVNVNRGTIYDDHNNYINSTGSRKKLSEDSAVHTYKYESFQYDSKGFSPDPFYDYEDRVYVGLNYRFRKHKWRREPYAYQHTIGFNYSISQHSISSFYNALLPALVGKWDLVINLDYDPVRWTNLYGLGNETALTTKKRKFYQLRTEEWSAVAGLQKIFGKNEFEFGIFYQRVKIRKDTASFADKIFQGVDPILFKSHHYVGLRMVYSHVSLNDSIVPTRGISVLAKGILANSSTRNEFFQNYILRLQAFIPLSNKFSLALRAGGGTVFGPASGLHSGQVLEHAVIGGPESLRGYRMERFWGKTAFYNNNELRFITNIRTYIVNARLGFLVFFDDGRVWIPQENSDRLHTAYGVGVLFAPFHLLSCTVTYGISNEIKLFQFKINTPFN